MGAQGGFSEADFIPPGHTSRGLRPSAGRLCLCVGVDLSLQQQTHVSTAHVPPYVCGFQVSVLNSVSASVAFSSFFSCWVPDCSGLLQCHCLQTLEQVTEKEGLWRLRTLIHLLHTYSERAGE